MYYYDLEENYETRINCPINMTIDEWNEKQAVKAQELAEYQAEQDAESLPF